MKHRQPVSLTVILVTVAIAALIIAIAFGG